MPTRTEAEQAAAEVRRKNLEADELERSGRAAREGAAEAAERAKQSQREFERQLKRSEADFATEIRALSDKLAQARDAKLSSERPAPGSRGLARRFLHMHMGIDHYPEVERLASDDSRFFEFYGIYLASVDMPRRAFAADIRDDALFAAIDALECSAWREVVQRAKQLAGEAES